MPLKGIKVADFSQAMSGPTATMLMGDFGAEIIKIEPPVGDNSRRWGFARYGNAGEFSSQFLALNRNKASISIDLKLEAGTKLARSIIAACDVVIESFKPGVMARLGLGYEELGRSHPGLVYCSISGFGQTGPLASRPGYDQLMQAYAGLLSVTGEPDRPAVRIGPSAIDMLTGAHAVIGILAALRERERSGRGQHIDTSLYETAVHLMTHMIVDYTGTGRQIGRNGPYFAYLAPYGIFAAEDREFFIGISTDAMWKRFCAAIARQDLAADARFLSNRERSANSRALYAILEPLFKEKSAAHWVGLAEELAIPTSLINDLSEVVLQEQALAREAIVDVAGGHAGIKSAGLPIKLSRTPAQIRSQPPGLAENTDDVLAALGLAPDDIAALRRDKVIK